MTGAVSFRNLSDGKEQINGTVQVPWIGRQKLPAHAPAASAVNRPPPNSDEIHFVDDRCNSRELGSNLSTTH
jgi:hypothetical protein